MELPHIGQHCSQTTCKQLDFLPMKCDACGKIFCRDHIAYVTHTCPESYKKDNQIPVCPLCNRPCPLMKGELPDVVVGRHIESDCQSDPAKERRKIYTNRCSKTGCKKKELIPVSCETCRRNFCLRHRHERDHDCEGFQGRGISRAGAAALQRVQQSVPSTSKKPASSGSSHSGNRNQSNASSSAQRDVISSLQNGMGEDEALARALQLSMVNDSDDAQTEAARRLRQEEEDSLLAQALSMSEQETRRATQNRQHHQPSTEKCAVQ